MYLLINNKEYFRFQRKILQTAVEYEYDMLATLIILYNIIQLLSQLANWRHINMSNPSVGTTGYLKPSNGEILSPLLNQWDRVCILNAANKKLAQEGWVCTHPSA